MEFAMGFFFKVLPSIIVGGKHCSTDKANEVSRVVRNSFFMTFVNVLVTVFFSINFSSQYQQEAK
jgi:hypothetical protein